MEDYKRIGDNLKRLRTGMGLSLDAVSALTGVSKTMLSQIERSESVPTLATISKIANGLKLRFDNLLSGSETSEYEIKNIKDISPVIDNEGKTKFYCLFPFSPTCGFEIFYCIFRPGCNHVSETHINGKTEYIMLSSGELELKVGTNTLHLRAGDSVSFDASENHAYMNKGPEDAIVYFVLSYK